MRKPKRKKVSKAKKKPKTPIKPFLVCTIADVRSLKKMPKDRIIHATKATDKDGLPPIFPEAWGLGPYNLGRVFNVTYWDKNPDHNCGSGLNVATKQWCNAEFGSGVHNRLWMVEFQRKDIVCIPNKTDGKFRVKRLKVVAELSWDCTL